MSKKKYAIPIIPSLGRIKENCGSWQNTAKSLYKILQDLDANNQILDSCYALIKPSAVKIKKNRTPVNTLLSMKHDLAKAGVRVKRVNKLKNNKEAASAVLEFISRAGVYQDTPEDRQAAISNLSKRISEYKNRP